MSLFRFNTWFWWLPRWSTPKVLGFIAVIALLVSFARVRYILELAWKGYWGPFSIRPDELPRLLNSHRLIAQVVAGGRHGMSVECHVSGPRIIVEHTAHWRKDGSLAETVVVTRCFYRGLQLKFVDGLLTDLEQLGAPRVPLPVEDLDEWEEEQVLVFMDLLHEKSPIPLRPRRRANPEPSLV